MTKIWDLLTQNPQLTCLLLGFLILVEWWIEEDAYMEMIMREEIEAEIRKIPKPTVKFETIYLTDMNMEMKIV